MRQVKHILFVMAFGLSFEAFGHGEDKPGPQGGHIRMPGAFHTELLIEGQDKVKVFLLDMEWKNPTTKNSNLEVRLGEDKATCTAEAEAYLCSWTKKVNLKKGKLVVLANREGLQGNEAVYDLPLKWPKSSSPQKAQPKKEDSHHHHH